MFFIYVLNVLTLYFWLLLVCRSDYHSTGESANAKSRRCIPERQTEVLTGVLTWVESAIYREETRASRRRRNRLTSNGE